MQQLRTASPVHRQFEHEWQRLRHRPDAVRRVRGWHLVTGPLDDLDQIVAMTLPPRPDADRERVLHALVERARDDELAARIVLQRLVPDLVLVHRRRGWRDDVGFGDLLATGWTVIRTYNGNRRPARLAASLVSDIDYREYRAERRRIGHGRPQEPWRFDLIVDETPTDAAGELASLLGDPASSLTADEHDLVRRLLTGRTAIDIAGELDITPRTLRNRRDRIADKLRSVALAA